MHNIRMANNELHKENMLLKDQVTELKKPALEPKVIRGHHSANSENFSRISFDGQERQISVGALSGEYNDG